MVEFRPHHFLCILTFVGKGYSRSFTENFLALATKINELIAQHGQVDIKIIDTPDDICKGFKDAEGNTCLHNRHCLDEDVKIRDQQALKAVARLLSGQEDGLAVGSTISLTAETIKSLRSAFKHDQAFREACQSCSWFDACTYIAKTYGEVRIAPKACP